MNSVLSSLENNCSSTSYNSKKNYSIGFLIILGTILIIFVFVSLRTGLYDTSATEILKGIVGISDDNRINLIVRNNRLPRICTALVSGAGLGLVGCILQAVLHNPLASPSTLGVSQGATFGAAVAIVVVGLGNHSIIGITLLSFTGSVAVAALILVLSRFRQISAEGIVLAGVAISAMLTGATTLIQYFANDIELATIVFWTFGDLGNTTWSDIRKIMVIVLLLILFSVLHRWDYNALLSGEETAISLGINVKRLTLTSMIICCLTSSVIVSNIGLVNFIGLIAPHIVRLAVGNNYIYLIPGSTIAGSLILLLSDLFARMAISPIILPIGAITSFLGGPLFLFLLLKRGRRRC